jgi:starch synthase
VYLKTLYRGRPELSKVRTVFTVHNMGYQGLFWHYDMPLTGLGWDLFTPEGIEFWGKINFLKAGLVFADVLNTVSERYAQEIQMPQFGHGLDGVLRRRRDDLFGILNGIDYGVWNPQADPFLAGRYSAADLSGKALCKRDLATVFGLPYRARTPVVGMISRLDRQKGFDILLESFDGLMQENLQFVLLGTGNPEYESRFGELAARWPERVGVRFTFSRELAHKIEAGADLFLMPSRYEPCGLNQLYSLRYGTVPVVRATGGLDDTVQDHHGPGEAPGTGFKFSEYSATALLEAMRRALTAYGDSEHWTRLMLAGMAQEFSWDRSARRYVEIYRRAVTQG